MLLSIVHPGYVPGPIVVGVAQLVERRIVIPVVVGSNPIVHPTFFYRRIHLFAARTYFAVKGSQYFWQESAVTGMHQL